MTSRVAMINLKGGVGKTALSVNFAAYCGLNGYTTLLIDLDPQTNATLSCISIDTWQKHAKTAGTVANLLGVRAHASAETREFKLEDVVVKNALPGVDLVPSHLELFTVDLDMAAQTARERRLKQALSDNLDDYDVIICDCPPNLTIPTQNAIALSTHYVVPLSPDFLSGLGVGLLINRVEEMSRDLELPIEHAGIVISRYGREAEHKRRTVSALKEKFGDKVINQHIGERTIVSQAAESNKSIFSMDNSDCKREFRVVSEEILKRIGI